MSTGHWALKARVKFPNAVFTDHYTKGFRETYLIPLPTTVAGMFGALFGIPRSQILEIFKDFLFGARMVEYSGVSKEVFGLVKFKTEKGSKRETPVEWGAGYQTILVKPAYEIYMATKDRDVLESLLEGVDYGRSIVYVPYGGNNDHPALDWELHPDILPVTTSHEGEGYASKQSVEKIVLEPGGTVKTGRVMFRGGLEEFVFIHGGRLRLNSEVYVVEGCILHPLRDFRYLVFVG